MPRDLIDLMERAASGAPPEPHAAADITRVAARHLRRRTTSLVAGVAAVVVVAGCVGYGVTRPHDSTPQPAQRLEYGKTVDFASAVPASTLPDYHALPWAIPSVQRFPASSGLAPIPTWSGVDAHGRLLVLDRPTGPGQRAGTPLRTRLYAAPGTPPEPLTPPSPGTDGEH